MNAQPIADTDKARTEDAARLAGEDFDTLRQDIAKLTQTVAQLVQHQAESAKSQVTEAYDAAKNKFVRSAADTQNRVLSLEAELEAQIERNPLTSVAVAMGVGLVLGMMSQSRG